MLYQLEKPTKLSREEGDEVILRMMSEPELRLDAWRYLEKANVPRYLYWDKVKFLETPKEWTKEQLWFLIKLLRRLSPSRKSSQVKSVDGHHFSYQLFPWMHQLLHEFDLNLGGEIAVPSQAESIPRARLISRGVIEEAIASSQLEGAATTRKVAKQMILERRRPRNKSEMMIMNNYNAMLHITEKLKDAKLCENAILELHAILTKDTLDAPKVGRLRTETDSICIVDSRTGAILHKPPPVKFVETELARLVEYANDRSPGKSFEHPVIKAITLHFWTAYLHPFVDGNGRLARGLFYWYLLKKGYWAFAYLPISGMIKKSPAQYRDAYLYTEQDDFDLTYFIDYNLRQIEQARTDFRRYLERTHQEELSLSLRLRERYQMNERQMELLRYFHTNAGASTTIKTHSRLYKVTRLTAAKDLEQLEALGYLKSSRIGRERVFTAGEKLTELS